jgi:hypothetical protein
MKKAPAFTLVEVIAASALLAIGVVVVAAITSRSLDALRYDTDYARAWEVLDRQLTVIEYIGIDTVVQKDITKGNFTERDTNYSWSLAITQEPYDKLQKIDITVAWLKGGKARSISASTMFNGTGVVGEQTALPEEGETMDESGGDMAGTSGAAGGTQ